jgi:aryl-alcohol dehydrogenase-like predicted oxidoreductase
MVMQNRSIGSTGVSVSVIGFGGWVLGTSWWGTLTEEAGRSLVRRALDRGITFFDTADAYGDDGISETLLADALAGVPRDQYVLGTKFGYDITLPRDEHTHSERPQRWEATFIRSACEASLRRLRTDVIDVYEMHNPRMNAIDDDEAFATLESLRDEGKIRSFGVALGPAIGWEEEGVHALLTRRVDVLQTVYNMLEQDPGRRFMQEAATTGAAVLARVPHASGALEGKISKDTTFAAGDHRSFRNRQMLIDLLDKAETLRWLHQDGRRTIAQLALQYAVAQPGITSVLPTMTSIEQLDEFTAATDAPPLTTEELRRVDELYAENFGVERREYARR